LTITSNDSHPNQYTEVAILRRIWPVHL